MHDEEKAIEELGRLSVNAKLFLSHEIRNSLQVIMHSMRNNHQAVPALLFQFENKLKKIGV